MKKQEFVQKIVLAAKAMVFRGDGKMLLLRRSETDPRRPLTWDLPGGVVEKGENPKLACIRETKEEAGISIENLQIDTIRHVEKGDKDYPVSSHYYRCETKDEEISLSFEHDKYVWTEPKDIRNYEMPEHYLRMIEKSNK